MAKIYKFPLLGVPCNGFKMYKGENFALKKLNQGHKPFLRLLRGVIYETNKK